jgi:hypothetical protein
LTQLRASPGVGDCVKNGAEKFFGALSILVPAERLLYENRIKTGRFAVTLLDPRHCKRQFKLSTLKEHDNAIHGHR